MSIVVFRFLCAFLGWDFLVGEVVVWYYRWPSL